MNQLVFLVIFCLNITNLLSLEEQKEAPAQKKTLWELTETVWGLGIASTCDIGPCGPACFQQTYWDPIPNYQDSDLDKLKPGDTVWIKSRFVPYFAKEVLKKIKVPVVIVITEGDESFPSKFKTSMDVDSFINSEKIIHIFTQNCDLKEANKKVGYVPIGVDFHSIATRPGFWGENGSPLVQEAALKEILKGLKPTPLRKKRAFVDFQHNDSIRHGGDNRHLEFGEDRATIFKRVSDSGLVDHGPRMKRSDLWKTKGQYAFSISPHGNGLDCHRTWEDLVLGCIVIVKTSPIDPIYEGLPVVIVKDWSEITQENMEAWLKKYGDVFSNKSYREKLTNAHWVNKIRAVQKEFRERSQTSG